MPIEYVLGLPEACRGEAAALYDEAFRQKLEPAIRDGARRRAVLAESLDLRCAVVALEGGRLLGLAGLHLDGRSFTGACRAGVLLRRLGLWEALRALLLLALLERKPEPGELLLDGIVVHPSARGRGIGGALLDRVVSEARARGLARVRLEVVDTNPRARRLYEKKGFVVRETTPTPFLCELMGFGAATTLVKAVD